MKKRILFYVHDGSGIGHLQIIARIASSLQDRFSTLIITGHRCASWIVRAHCEFIYFPSWDNLTYEKASYWGREPWLNLSLDEAINFKGQLFLSILNTYKPDLIIVDNLPFGKYNEIREGIISSNARKYLVHRGIIGCGDIDTLCGDASKLYSNFYDRMLLAADKCILDFAAKYKLEAGLVSKISYVGYITPSKNAFNREVIRSSKGLVEGQQWVVCSAGGGMKAEKFLNKCTEAAVFFPEVRFDVVFGPRSRRELIATNFLPNNVQIFEQEETLPEMHGACDVAIINGGYNSIMEAAIGGACIIVYPNQVNVLDEQVINTINLKRYYPVSLLENCSNLVELLTAKLDMARTNPRPIFPLDINGIQNIMTIIETDLLNNL